MLHCHLRDVWDCAGRFWHDFTVLLQQSHDADTNTFHILQMRKLAPPHLCFGRSWLFPEASYPSLAQPWQLTRSDLARVRAVELNTWACNLVINRNLMRLMRCAVRAPLRFPDFPVLAVAASSPSGCVGISWFLTHPLLGTKAPLKINNICILRLKDYCFLCQSEEAGPGKGKDRDVPRIPNQDHVRAGQEP